MNNKNLEEPLLPPAKGLTLRNTMPPPSENEESMISSASKTIKPATAWNRVVFGGRKKRLIYAAQNGNLSVVRELIEDYGIDIDSVDSNYGITALAGASIFGRLEVARYLVENGADVNAARTFDGMTALLWACSKGHLDIVRYLVEHGANVNAAAKWGMTALMRACYKGHAETVRWLVEHGANVNAAKTDNGMTALMWACFGGHLEIVRYLCQNGADATITDTYGKMAIDWTKYPKIRNILLEGCSSQASATAAPQGGYYRRTRHRRRHKKHSKHATRLRKRK